MKRLSCEGLEACAVWELAARRLKEKGIREGKRAEFCGNEYLPEGIGQIRYYRSRHVIVPHCLEPSDSHRSHTNTFHTIKIYVSIDEVSHSRYS